MQSQRYFELQDNKSAKFWEITTDGTAVTVRYGKIGTNGQSQTKELANAAAAAKHVAKLVAEKTGKGYVESGVNATAQAASETTSALPPTAAPRKKAATAKKTAVTNPAKDPEASPESLLALLNKDDATNRLLARHPRASADLLEKLSHSSDKATRQGVAANPNTPPEVYLRLGQQFPKEFLANPMLDLLLLERPALLHEQPDTLLVQILRHATCPEDFLLWAAGHESEKVQLAVAMNPKAPEQAKDKLRQSLYPKVRDSLPNIETEITPEVAEAMFREEVRKRLTMLDEYDTKKSWEKKDIGLPQWKSLSVPARLDLEVANYHEIWSSAKFPADVFSAVSKKEGSSIRWYISKNPKTPKSVLAELAKDKYIFAREGVAKNPSTPREVLEQLAQDESSKVRAGIAVNYNCPSTLLSTLSKDSDLDVRFGVANNTSTPPEVLEILAQDMHPNVRKGVAENPNSPANTLDTLAKDVEKDVRLGVAKNLSSPSSALKALAQDADLSIRCNVSENIASPPTALAILAQDKSSEVQRTVARNPSTPLDLLKLLTQRHYDVIRWGVAENPSSTPELLQYLVQYFPSRVATNPSAPIEILQKLAQDEDELVRANVAGNPNCPSEILELLATDPSSTVRSEIAKNPHTPQAVLEKISIRVSKEIRNSLLENTSTPPSVLDSFSVEKDENVRISVARHPNTSNETLSKLASDVSITVRMAVLNNKSIGNEIIEIIHNHLFGNPEQDPWFLNKLQNSSGEVKHAVAIGNILYYSGKDPNRAVLSNRPISKLMALCAGPFIDPDRMAKVSKSTDWLIRAGIAINQGAPANILKKLSGDTHPVVASLAKNASSMISIPTSAVEIEKSVTSKPSELNEGGNKDHEELIKSYLWMLKGNRYIGAKLATKIIGIDDRVDLALSKNPMTAQAVLKKLSKSKDVSVRRNILRHHNTPYDVKIRMAPEFISDFLKDDGFWWMPDSDLLKTMDYSLIKKLLVHKNCPDSLKEFCSTMGIS